MSQAEFLAFAWQLANDKARELRWIAQTNFAAKLAEEAVISEPVSARWFPVPRENTGKFANFGLEIANAPRLSEENSIACQRNSLVTKAGKICGRSGNLRRGNCEPYANNGTRCLALAPAGSYPGLDLFKNVPSGS